MKQKLNETKQSNKAKQNETRHKTWSEATQNKTTQHTKWNMKMKQKQNKR